MWGEVEVEKSLVSNFFTLFKSGVSFFVTFSNFFAFAWEFFWFLLKFKSGFRKQVQFAHKITFLGFGFILNWFVSLFLQIPTPPPLRKITK